MKLQAVTLRPPSRLEVLAVPRRRLWTTKQQTAHIVIDPTFLLDVLFIAARFEEPIPECALLHLHELENLVKVNLVFERRTLQHQHSAMFDNSQFEVVELRNERYRTLTGKRATLLACLRSLYNLRDVRKSNTIFNAADGVVYTSSG